MDLVRMAIIVVVMAVMSMSASRWHDACGLVDLNGMVATILDLIILSLPVE